MRGRNDDPDLWGDLYEKVRGHRDPTRRQRGSGLSPDASGRLYDAALGILGSIRTFVDVAEEVLEERRARVGEGPIAASPWVRTPEDRGRPRPVPPYETGSAVRDIPFGES